MKEKYDTSVRGRHNLGRKRVKLDFAIRPNTTTSYIASAAYNDGTGRFRDYWFDHSNSNSVFETVNVTTR